MNKFISLVAAIAFTMIGCSESKTPANNASSDASANAAVSNVATSNATAQNAVQANSAEAPIVEGTKTIALANGAVVTWIQDNEGKKFMPRELFSDASDSLYASLNMPAGLPASVSTFLVKVDSK